MGARILVADDSVTIQKVVELTFSREGVELTPARSGQEALRMAQEIKPDLMLIDLSMPDMSGYEVCATLRKSPLFKEVPIILLAGTFEPFNEAEGRRVGANDFVSKPFDSQTLIGKVRQLLSARPGPPVVEVVPEPPAAPPPPEEFLFELQEAPSAAGLALEPPTPAVQEPLTQVMPEEPAIPVYDLTLEEGPGFPLGSVVPDSPPELAFELPELAVEPPAPAVQEVQTVEVVQEVQKVQEVQAPPQTVTISPDMVDALAREVAERVATQVAQELKGELLDRIERVLWEVVPDLAEHLITQEIQRIRNEVEGK